jgi:hypothetical protein
MAFSSSLCGTSAEEASPEKPDVSASSSGEIPICRLLTAGLHGGECKIGARFSSEFSGTGESPSSHVGSTDSHASWKVSLWQASLDNGDLGSSFVGGSTKSFNTTSSSVRAVTSSRGAFKNSDDTAEWMGLFSKPFTKEVGDPGLAFD